MRLALLSLIYDSSTDRLRVNDAGFFIALVFIGYGALFVLISLVSSDVLRCRYNRSSNVAGNVMHIRAMCRFAPERPPLDPTL
jgi:hypothetical protein